MIPRLLPEAFAKADPSDDAAFYRPTRLVTHIDEAAIVALTAHYAVRIVSGAAVGARVNGWQVCGPLLRRGDFALLAVRYALRERAALTAFRPLAEARGAGIVIPDPPCCTKPARDSRREVSGIALRHVQASADPRPPPELVRRQRVVA